MTWRRRTWGPRWWLRNRGTHWLSIHPRVQGACAGHTGPSGAGGGERERSVRREQGGRHRLTSGSDAQRFTGTNATIPRRKSGVEASGTGHPQPGAPEPTWQSRTSLCPWSPQRWLVANRTGRAGGGWLGTQPGIQSTTPCRDTWQVGALGFVPAAFKKTGR